MLAQNLMHRTSKRAGAFGARGSSPLFGHSNLVSGRGIVAVVTMLACGGCGHSGPETVGIQGNLTFAEGKTPPHCVVYFQPKKAAEGLPLRPAHGKVDEQGRFIVTSFNRGDGLVPGTYGVSVEHHKLKPGGDPLREDGWVRHTTQLDDLTIEPGSKTVEANYNVPK